MVKLEWSGLKSILWIVVASCLLTTYLVWNNLLNPLITTDKYEVKSSKVRIRKIPSSRVCTVTRERREMFTGRETLENWTGRNVAPHSSLLSKYQACSDITLIINNQAAALTGSDYPFIRLYQSLQVLNICQGYKVEKFEFFILNWLSRLEIVGTYFVSLRN